MMGKEEDGKGEKYICRRVKYRVRVDILLLNGCGKIVRIFEWREIERVRKGIEVREKGMGTRRGTLCVKSDVSRVGQIAKDDSSRGTGFLASAFDRADGKCHIVWGESDIGAR